MAAEFELLTGRDLHDQVVLDAVLGAESHVWIATADLKDMHVKVGRKHKPILEVFDRMARAGVRFRIIHSNTPSRPFQQTLERLPALSGGALELQICLRSHWKIVIVDGLFGWFGSANFTGAGLGGRRDGRRNLEIGAASRDPAVVGQLVEHFDRFWVGEHCVGCSFLEVCPDPIALDSE